MLIMILLPATAVAQDHQARYIADFQRMRGNVIAMVDSMPAAGLRSAPTEGVRDFAEQIEHVAGGNVNLIASGTDAGQTDLVLDPEVYLNDKRIVQAAHEHKVWTLGATTPYVRLAGGTPPSYGLVPEGMIESNPHPSDAAAAPALAPYATCDSPLLPAFSMARIRSM